MSCGGVRGAGRIWGSAGGIWGNAGRIWGSAGGCREDAREYRRGVRVLKGFRGDSGGCRGGFREDAG